MIMDLAISLILVYTSLLPRQLSLRKVLLYIRFLINRLRSRLTHVDIKMMGKEGGRSRLFEEKNWPAASEVFVN